MAARTVRQPGRGGRGKRKTSRHWLVRASNTILAISTVVLIASGAYIIYGILGGHLASGGEDAGRSANIFETASTAFTVASILVCTCLFVRYYDTPMAVYAGALPGLLAFFAIPFLIGTQAGQDSTTAERLVQSMRLCGEVVFMIVALRAGIAVVDRLRRPPEEKKPAERSGKPEPPKKPGVKPPIWAKCWQLSYCHEMLREVCPTYEQRKSCWRTKQGCNCDPAMIDRLVEARSTTKGLSREQRQAAGQYTRSEATTTVGARQLITCDKCPIYAEHQRQKFLLVNPIVVIASIIAFYFAAPLYTKGYAAAVIQLDDFCVKFAFKSDTTPRQPVLDPNVKEDEYNWRVAREKYKDMGKALVARDEVVPESRHRMASWLGGELNERTVHWIVYGVLCIFVLTQVLQVVEWSVFKMHW